MKEDITKFLRNITFDVSDDETVEIWAECTVNKGDTCPKHRKCGLCRYEYMKRKGWLSAEAK